MTAENQMPPHASSGATCRLLGHKVELIGWNSAGAEPKHLSRLSGTKVIGLTFARGTGWSAAVADDAAPDAQKAVAQKVADALGGTVVR